MHADLTVNARSDPLLVSDGFETCRTATLKNNSRTFEQICVFTKSAQITAVNIIQIEKWIVTYTHVIKTSTYKVK